MSSLRTLSAGAPAALAISALLAASCGESADDPGPIRTGRPATGVTASADLQDPMGRSVGTARLTETTRGVLVHLRLGAAPSGIHAFHIHEVGLCEPPGFESAGPHFNPSRARHGFANADGAHAGDLPNLHLAAGAAEIEIMVPGATLDEGVVGLLDGDGAALVLHGAADDYRTDPAGNAGSRIACGVITR